MPGLAPSGSSGSPTTDVPVRRRRETSVTIVFETHSTTTDDERWIASVETARIAFGRRGFPLFLDWRLRGCDYGELTGTPVAALEVERAMHVYDPYPDGESYSQVAERVRSFLHDVAPRHAEERIAVIGHAATKWALDHLLEGTPLPELVAGSFRWKAGWLYRLAVDS